MCQKQEMKDNMTQFLMRTLYDSKKKVKRGNVRNLQFPKIYKQSIENKFSKDKILFYGSLALNKSNISDYDLMYIPNEYQNTQFDISHMETMFSFITEMSDMMNNICTKEKL